MSAGGNQGAATIVQPTGGVALPLTTAQSTPPNVAQTAEQMREVQASLPGENIVDVDDDEGGDAPADLDNRIDALMRTVQQ